MITKINEFRRINESGKKLTVYHRSDSLEHMLGSEFDLEFSDGENAIFGQAIYFGGSANMLDSQLGEYLCKFEITLDQPTLDMNKVMTCEQANELLDKFNSQFGTTIKYYNKQQAETVDTFDFSDDYNGVQYGEFFLELQDILRPQPNTHYREFIESMGYRSFMHYATFGSDFITSKGDYGRVYGIYSPQNIRFVDGPF